MWQPHLLVLRAVQKQVQQQTGGGFGITIGETVAHLAHLRERRDDRRHHYVTKPDGGRPTTLKCRRVLTLRTGVTQHRARHTK
jgi:hypothetical protein